MQKTLKNIVLLLFIGVMVVTSLEAGKNTIIPKSRVIEVQPDNNRWYVGIGIGTMKLKDDFTSEYFETKPVLLQLGYQFNPYLAIEGRFIRSVGKVKYENGITLSPDDNDFPTTFSNIATYLKLEYPKDNFSVYTLLGYGEVSLTDIRGADRIEDGFQWGIGFSYKLSENSKVFFDYNNLYNGNGFSGRAKIVKTHVNFAVIGVSYVF